MECKWCGEETGKNITFCNDKCKHAYETYMEDQDYEEERILDTW